MWHSWYLLGASGGFAAALFIISRAAQRLHVEHTREAMENMVWSTIGALLMMPVFGVVLTAMIYMATR